VERARGVVGGVAAVEGRAARRAARRRGERGRGRPARGGRRAAEVAAERRVRAADLVAEDRPRPIEMLGVDGQGHEEGRGAPAAARRAKVRERLDAVAEEALVRARASEAARVRAGRGAAAPPPARRDDDGGADDIVAVRGARRGASRAGVVVAERAVPAPLCLCVVGFADSRPGAPAPDVSKSAPASRPARATATARSW